MAKDFGLTEKQKKFADSYLISGNAKQSCAEAGYSTKGRSADTQGSKLLSNANIQKYLEEQRKVTGAKHVITRDKVIDKLSRLMDHEDPKVQLKAIDTINKMCGFNEPEKQDVTGSLDVAITYQVVGSREDVKELKGE